MTRIVVIAGWERSGSTIIANALGSAPGAVSVGEINNVWERGFGEDRICSCGERFSRCALWRPVAAAAFGGDPAGVARQAAAAIGPLGNLWLLKHRLPVLGRDAAGAAAPYRRLLAPLFRALAEETGADTIVDASKLPWHAAAVAGLAGFDVTILHVIRNPYGVAYSHLKRTRYDTDDDRPLYMDRHGVVPSSLAWVYRNRLTEATWRNDPRYVMVRYEDFIADPPSELARVRAAEGSPPSLPTFPNPGEVLLRPTHNISGNPVRFQHGSVRLNADEAWRSDLAPRTAQLVAALTWPHRRHYGYEN